MKTKKVTFNITQRDIDRGCACDGDACPIARAVRRKLFGCWHVNPNSLARHRRNLGPDEYDLPDVARSFVQRFDAGNGVSPLKFDMNIPARYVR